MRALASLDQFQQGTSLRGWTFTILRNAFYEQARRRRTEQIAISQGFEAEEAAAPEQHGHLELSDLQRQLFRLPALLREALVLVGAQQLSYEDAAAICGIPVGTMKARVSRGRAQLAAVVGAPEAAGASDAQGG